MNEPITRPILFSAPMVRALLSVTKTQTRRVVKPQSKIRVLENGAIVTENGWLPELDNPYGARNDRLYVRETWATSHRWDGIKPSELPGKPTDESAGVDIYYRATDDSPQLTNRDGGIVQNWRPSIFMPRWASRITLEIESVRVERLQEISEEDAKSEGVEYWVSVREPSFMRCRGILNDDYHRRQYEDLWGSINGPGSWVLNPWVWVVTFRKL